MGYTLKKPYTDKQRADFIVEYNHNRGLKIEETQNSLFALEPWESLVDDEIQINPNYEEELKQQQRQDYDSLSLTAADVERALYKARGIDFEDIIDIIKEDLDSNIDLKGLKIELKAKDFYRGNPYINQIGAMLDISEENLDKFFETNDYTYLIKETEE